MWRPRHRARSLTAGRGAPLGRSGGRRSTRHRIVSRSRQGKSSTKAANWKPRSSTDPASLTIRPRSHQSSWAARGDPIKVGLCRSGIRLKSCGFPEHSPTEPRANATADPALQAAGAAIYNGRRYLRWLFLVVLSLLFRWPFSQKGEGFRSDGPSAGCWFFISGISQACWLALEPGRQAIAQTCRRRGAALSRA
jgi:hypothetical protein